MKSHLRFITLAAGIGLGWFSSATAQNRTWTGAGSGSAWNTNGNWSSNNRPDSSAETAVFGTSAKTAISVNLSSPVEVGGMTFNAGASAYTFTLPNTGYLDLSGAGITNNSGQIQTFLIDEGGDFRLSNTATLGASTRFTVSGENTFLYLQHNAQAGSADITVRNSAQLFIGADETSAADAGNATITVESGGSVTFSGTSTGNQSAFTITEGSVYFNQASNPANASFTLGDSGTLGFDQRDTMDPVTVASLSGSGRVDLGGRTLRTGAVSTLFSGTIGSSGSVAGLEKIGAGTLTLSGYSWDLNDPTTVTAGRLVVDGFIGNSAVTVQSGATLAGSGTVGSLTITPGGILAPGNSPGLLNAGYTIFESGGILELQIQDAGGEAGTGYDLLALDGPLNLEGISGDPFTIRVVSLASPETAGLAVGFDPASSYAFTFLTTTGGISGFSEDVFALDFSGFSNPFTGTWAIALVHDEHDLVLTYTGAGAAVPEPSTYALMAGLAGLGFVIARRSLAQGDARLSRR